MGTSFNVVVPGLLAAGLLVSGRLGAETPAEAPRPYRFTWAAPEGCPAERELAARIDRLLATSTLTQAALDVAVSANVARVAGGRFRGRIEIASDGAASSRRLEAGSCDAVASATALIVATVIDPAAVERAQAAAAEPEAPAVPKAEPAPEAPVVPPQAPPPKKTAPPPIRKGAGTRAAAPAPRPVTWAVGVLSWGGVGMLPGLAWGFAESVSVGYAPFSAGLEVQYWAPQGQASADHPSVGADFERFSGGANACFTVLEARAVLDACVGLDFILVRGLGYGVRESRLGTHRWLAPFVGGAVRFPLSTRLRLVGRIEASFPLSRDYFEIDGVGVVYRLPLVGARAGLGLALAF